MLSIILNWLQIVVETGETSSVMQWLGHSFVVDSLNVIHNQDCFTVKGEKQIVVKLF